MRVAFTVLLALLFVSSYGGVAAADEATKVGAGLSILVKNSDRESKCTLSVSGFDAQNRMVGITAGHCGPVGSLVATVSAPFDYVGTIAHVNMDLDYGIIEFRRDAVMVSNSAFGVSVRSLGTQAQIANWVCKEGASTGNTCGPSLGVRVIDRESSLSIVCAAEGDSGGPVVAGESLVGVLTGVLPPNVPVRFVPCPTVIIATNLNYILADLNSSTQIGAGFRIG